MIAIYPNTKIYIACPPNVASGGPELLHQLAYNLKNILNIETYMFYYPIKNPKINPIHPEYRTYNIRYTFSIEDNKQNILIVPEIKSLCELIEIFRNIRKGVWFLSVDNYYLSRVPINMFFINRLFNKIFKKILNKPIFDITEHLDFLIERINITKDKTLLKANFYMVNTFRGYKFLENHGLKPLYYLSEYLNEVYLMEKVNKEFKENIITFNPQKGLRFTEKIIKKIKNQYKIIPIANMNRTQVINTLKKAKVYIDFGNHPGKDRLPREAAILGCCVITGKRGSAAYFEDVPIPEEYKFDDKEENIHKIIEKIKECIENYDEKIKDFEYYREVIKKEPEKFISDLKSIFVKVEK